MYAGVSRITQAACSIAVGESQPCSFCTIFIAGMAAERMSGYLPISVSIASRTCAGTYVVAGSGTTAGSLVRSTESSQPGTREPWA